MSISDGNQETYKLKAFQRFIHSPAVYQTLDHLHFHKHFSKIPPLQLLNVSIFVSRSGATIKGIKSANERIKHMFKVFSQLYLLSFLTTIRNSIFLIRTDHSIMTDTSSHKLITKKPHMMCLCRLSSSLRFRKQTVQRNKRGEEKLSSHEKEGRTCDAENRREKNKQQKTNQRGR